MGKRGRPLHPDNIITPKDHLEAFCCLQVERIERSLAQRYDQDYWSHKWKDRRGGNKAWMMPQNEHMSRKILETETIITWRK